MFLLLLGICLSTGCSDKSTGPGGTTPTPTELEHKWSHSFGDALEQFSYDIACDASGNVIIAGYFEGTVDFGGGALVSTGQEDIFIAKFGSDGTHIWSYRFGDASDQYAYSVTTDASGNVIVAGRFWGIVNFGGGALSSAGASDIYVAKFSPGGTYLWSKRFGDSSVQEAKSVTADASGNVIITGSYFGTVDFGSGPLPTAGNQDIFLAKFNSDGAHLWSNKFGDGDSQFGKSVACDASGNIILVGDIYGSADFGGGSLTSAGGPDIFVAKFGSGGAHTWSKRFGDADEQLAPCVEVDASGNVIIVGYFEGTADFGGSILTSAGAVDFLMAKFSPDGSHLWSSNFGDLAYQYAYSAAADASGNIIVAGYFTGTVDFGGGTLTSNGAYDILIARFSSGGAHLWSDSFGDSDAQFSLGVAADASGNGFIVGSFQGTVDFGSGDLTSAGMHDIFVAKFGL